MITYLLSLLGVAVFAMTGALAAGRKGYDWVGVISIAFVTALGGGTIRDLLLNREYVFWISDPNYVWLILITSIFTIIYVRYQRPPDSFLLTADAYGLGLFAIAGAQIAEAANVSIIVIILMGVITGAAGGVLRDLLTQESPIAFSPQEPLYSSVATFGLICYLGLKIILPEQIAEIFGITIIASARLLAIRYQIFLPQFKV